MIESLELNNFQSHKLTKLKFHKGVNAIIGTSNSGKTALLRGLYWINYNRPTGIAFVSSWNRDKKGNPVKETSATITTDNHIVSRVRSTSFNGYTIDETSLEAVALSVPADVTNSLHLGEVNIQKQMDAPFLLSESAGEVARFFNNEINLSLIDAILSGAEMKRRKYNSDIKQNEIDLKNIEEELKEYDNLPDAQKLIKEIESLEDKELSTSIDSLDSLITQIEENENDLVVLKTINFEKVLSIQTEIEAARTEYKNIDNDIYIIEDIISTHRDNIDHVKVLKKELVELNKQLPKCCPLCGNQLKGGDQCVV